MLAEVKKWGNSYAIRLSKREFDALGIHEGDQVQITVKKLAKEGKIDLSGLPVFRDVDRRPFREIREDYYRNGVLKRARR